MLAHPLHPAVIHFPIVLMLMLPVVTALVLWRLHDGTRRRVWGVVVLAAALTVASGMVAKETGEDQEERVERVLASEAPLKAHEEAADAFLLGAWIVLAMSLAGFAPRLAGRIVRWGTLAGTLALAWLGWRVGDLGGELVYRHGAARAYTVPGPSVDGQAMPSGRADRDEHE